MYSIKIVLTFLCNVCEAGSINLQVIEKIKPNVY